MLIIDRQPIIINRFPLVSLLLVGYYLSEILKLVISLIFFQRSFFRGIE